MKEETFDHEQNTIDKISMKKMKVFEFMEM